MSQNYAQEEQKQAQSSSLNTHNKQPFFSAKKEEEAYEITLQLNQPLNGLFSHFTVHYYYADKRVNYEPSEAADGKFHLRISLSELFTQAADSKKELIRFYFTIAQPSDDKEEGVIKREIPISLSQFEQFDGFGLTQTIYQQQVFIPYFSGTEETFGIALNIPVPNTLYFAGHKLANIQTSKNTLTIQGDIAVKAFTLRETAVVLVGRRSGKETTFSTHHTLKETDHPSYLQHYTYSFGVDLDKFVQELLIEEVYDDDFDLYLEVYLDGLYQPIRIPLSALGAVLSKSIYKDLPISYGRSTMVIGINLAGPRQAVSLAFSKYQKNIYTYYRETAPMLMLKAPLNYQKNIWVIGEKPMEAKSNGWAFFRYMREQHPEQPVYYVLDEHSVDYEKAAAFDVEHLLPFKSKKYIETLLAAKVLLFTESPYALYPSRSRMPLDLIRAKKILLQEHVLGLEDVRGTLGYTTKSFPVDLVLASSKTEERFLQQNLDYPENKIRLTGLARFDDLLQEDTSHEIASQITLYPQEYKFGHFTPQETVRETAEAFLSLVQNKEFVSYWNEHRLTAVVALPHAMREYSKQFQQAGCRVVFQEKADPITLLKDSKLFITDSHPLAFDASFKGISVLFYQPEMRFRNDVPASMLRHTYLNELPGEIVTSENSLMYMMQQIAVQDFDQSRKNRQKADALLEFPDAHSNERIFKALTEYLR